MFRSVMIKTGCQLEVVKEHEWLVRSIPGSIVSADTAEFKYYVLAVSKIKTVTDAINSGNFLNVLDFLTMNTKSHCQIKVPDGMASVTMFDTQVDALTAMRKLTRGLDANSVNLVSFKFKMPDVLRSVSVVPHTACLTGYSVLVADSSVKMANILETAEEITGVTGRINVSEGDHGYDDIRQLHQQAVESSFLGCMESVFDHVITI